MARVRASLRPRTPDGMWAARRGDVGAAAVLATVLALFAVAAPAAWVNVGVYALIYGLAAIGLTLLMGLAGQVSLGHAAFFSVGAYTQAVLVTRYDVPAFFAAVCAVSAASLLSLLVGLPLLRLRGHYLALATLGLGIIVGILASQSEFLGATSGTFGIAKPSMNGRVYDSPQEYFSLMIPVVVVGLLLARNVVESRMGRALAAVHDSEVAAESLGVNAFRLRLQVFVMAAAYAGLAGVFFAHWLAVVNPNSSSFLLSVELLLISVVGGLGSIWGALLGAFAIEFLEDALIRFIPSLVPGASGEVQLIGFGVVLVLTMIFVPGGLHHAWQLLAQWSRREAKPAIADRAAADAQQRRPATDAIAQRRPDPGGGPLLEVRGLTRRFGGLLAVDGVSFDVYAGEILALIGPNGAGKTTCFNLMSGVLAPTSGSVTMHGARVDGRKPHVFAEHQATRTFQNLKIFRSTSVLGNVMVGRHLRGNAGFLSALLAFPARHEERALRSAAIEAIETVGLGAERDRRAADLPFGRQRLVELARALAMEPDVLMLDEPLAGLAQSERGHVAAVLRTLRADGIAIVLVEHDMEAVLSLADRIAVLDDGQLIALGTPDAVRTDPAVIAAYLGVEDDDEVDEGTAIGRVGQE